MVLFVVDTEAHACAHAATAHPASAARTLALFRLVLRSAFALATRGRRSRRTLFRNRQMRGYRMDNLM